MSAVPAGTIRALFSWDFKPSLGGANADVFSQQAQALMVSQFGSATVLEPSIAINPAVDIWQTGFQLSVFGSMNVLEGGMVIVTRGTTSRAIADLIALAFSQCGVDAGLMSVPELAQKLDEGDPLEATLLTGPFGRVSMQILRLQTVPAAISLGQPTDPQENPVTSMTLLSRTTVRQGERTVVPSAIRPGSVTPAPRPPATERPYGGTPENPVLPSDGPENGVLAWLKSLPWGWIVLGGSGLALTGVVIHTMAPPQQPPPPPVLPRPQPPRPRSR